MVCGAGRQQMVHSRYRCRRGDRGTRRFGFSVIRKLTGRNERTRGGEDQAAQQIAEPNEKPGSAKEFALAASGYGVGAGIDRR